MTVHNIVVYILRQNLVGTWAIQKGLKRCDIDINIAGIDTEFVFG
jgi:hypothetical protein